MPIYLEPYHKLEHLKPNKNGYYLLHEKTHTLKLAKIHTPLVMTFQQIMTYNAQSRFSKLLGHFLQSTFNPKLRGLIKLKIVKLGIDNL
jgi:hypothetical protein